MGAITAVLQQWCDDGGVLRQGVSYELLHFYKKIRVNMGLYTTQKRIKSEEFQQVSSDSKMIEVIVWY